MSLMLCCCSVLPKNTAETKFSTLGTDFHIHIHSPPETPNDLQFNAGRALLAADSINIKRVLVISNAYSANITRASAEKENSFVIDESKKYPARVAAACAANPKTSWSLAEINRCAKLGVRIIKLHFMGSGLDLKKPEDYQRALATVEEIEKLNLSVLIHANYPVKYRGDEINYLTQLINRFPKIRWIIAHAYAGEYQRITEITHKNYFIDISALPFALRTPQIQNDFVQFVRQIGIQKFLFGSDWSVFHPAETFKAIKDLPFTKSEFNSLVFDNAAQLNDLFE